MSPHLGYHSHATPRRSRLRHRGHCIPCDNNKTKGLEEGQRWKRECFCEVGVRPQQTLRRLFIQAACSKRNAIQSRERGRGNAVVVSHPLLQYTKIIEAVTHQTDDPELLFHCMNRCHVSVHTIWRIDLYASSNTHSLNPAGTLKSANGS